MLAFEKRKYNECLFLNLICFWIFLPESFMKLTITGEGWLSFEILKKDKGLILITDFLSLKAVS